ncbi:MAG: hypothetical protein R2844_07515 [Caldilineales bacterium]
MKQPNSTRRALLLALGLAALLILSAVTVTTASQIAARQNAQATPAATESSDEAAADQPGGAFITINPEAGFPLDPFLVSVQAGGPVTASTLSEACQGYISEAPIVTADYQGEADTLKVFFYSDSDTTIVVETPDGDYLCNDDTNGLLLDPTVAISQPVTGTYSVWVGNSVPRGLAAGFLVFTTREDMSASKLALASLVKRNNVPEVLPLRDRFVRAGQNLQDALAAVDSPVEIEAGGDAITATVAPTGVLPAPELQTDDALCNGLVSLTPDLAFDWSGDTDALSVFVEADADTTLLVVAPDGSVSCSDDSGEADNLNPLVTIEQPAEGRYLVWVGRLSPDSEPTGTLTVTDAADAQPEALQP